MVVVFTSATATTPCGSTDDILYSTNGTNVDFVLTPSAGGSVELNVPDQLSSGGNCRGTDAVDFQVQRGAANNVASASQSLIAAGNSCTSSGVGSASMGNLTLLNGGNFTASVATEGSTNGGFASVISGSVNITLDSSLRRMTNVHACNNLNITGGSTVQDWSFFGSSHLSNGTYGGTGCTLPSSRYAVMPSTIQHSFGAGEYASINHSGCFVFNCLSGSSVSYVPTTADNQWRMIMGGGYYFMTSYGGGAVLLSSNSTWVSALMRGDVARSRKTDPSRLLSNFAAKVSMIRDKKNGSIGFLNENLTSLLNLDHSNGKHSTLSFADMDGLTSSLIQGLHAHLKQLKKKRDVIKKKIHSM